MYNNTQRMHVYCEILYMYIVKLKKIYIYIYTKCMYIYMFNFYNNLMRKQVLISIFYIWENGKKVKELDQSKR